MTETYKKSTSFLYRNARPIDLARWQYHFENGSRDAVVNALAYYQNADGGFGHALEADCFDPHSSPIQTWCTTEILREIGFTDSDSPVIRGILAYLDSGACFSEKQNQWYDVAPTANEYPRACWWNYSGDEGGQWQYNPTACLAGFVLRHADPSTELYRKCCRIAQEAYDFFVKSVPIGDEHVTSCFLRLYEYAAESGADLFDMDSFRDKLIEQVNHIVVRDPERWKTEYVPLPSRYIESQDSFLLAGNEDLIRAECRHILETQEPDGSYPVPWQWWNDYKEYTLSANWWKADFVIRNMRFLKEFGNI